MNTKERMLADVLIYTHLSKLPSDNYKGETPWMKAIVETVKADGSEGYAVAKSIDGTNFRILKDFGTVSPIVRYGKIYPYAKIKEQYIPQLKNREEVMIYLTSVYGNENEDRIRKSSNDELKKLIYAEAIRLTTLNSEYEYQKYNERKKYVTSLADEEEKLKESQSEEYLKKKDELIEYQKKVAKDEGTKKQRKTRKTAK